MRKQGYLSETDKNHVDVFRKFAPVPGQNANASSLVFSQRNESLAKPGAMTVG
jgi:hypothetical protein